MTYRWLPALLVLAAYATPASASILYAVTADDAAVPETLFVLDPRDATATRVQTLGNGDDGEAIAFNPKDRLMYHWSGNGGPTMVMESIDLRNGRVTNIPQSGDPHFEILGAVWDKENDRFLLTELLVRLFSASRDGIFTNMFFIAGAADNVSGLAFTHGKLYGVELRFPLLHTIDIATSSVSSTVTVTAPDLPGLTLVGFYGLATDPDSGYLWATASFSNGDRYLGTVTPNGIFNPVGRLSDKFSSIAFVDAPRTLDNPYQIRYTSNLTQGDSVINIMNTGANGNNLFGPGYGSPAGNICVNVYAFSPDEQMISCCSCLVTPNGLVHLTANNDLVSNTLTGVRPDSMVVKLVATGTGKDSEGRATYDGSSCSNSAALAGSQFPIAKGGLLAWGTTLHSSEGSGPPTSPATTFAVTETPFLPAILSAGSNGSELASLTNRCSNIIGNGSSFGLCKTCRIGGLGGSKL